MEHATTTDNPLIGRVLELLHMEGEVLLKLFLQTVVDMTRGNELTLLTEEGRVVDLEEHRHGRLINSNRRQGLGILEVADSVANLELLQADYCTDITALNLVSALVTHTIKGVELLNLGLLHRTIAMGNGDLHTVLEGAAMYATHGDTACVRAIVERGDQHLRGTLELLRSRNHLYNLIKKIGNVSGGVVVVLTHPSVLGRAIDNGEVELVLGSIQREHQVEYHLVDLLRTAVGLIYLINYHDRLQANLECLLQHETGLRHGALKSVDEQQTAVGHIKYTLYLATEVAMSRSIDDIDFGAFPIDRNVLGKNGDTALALQVIGVKYLVAQVLSLTEKISCQHHFVDQCCLTVVYVCNNCNVPNVLHNTNTLKKNAEKVSSAQSSISPLSVAGAGIEPATS